MSRNGSGVYTPPASSFPAVATTLIESAKFNAVINDIASALTASIAVDGQTVPTANLPMGGYRHTGIADAAARTDYCSAGQAQDNAFDALSSVSGTNTITATGPLGMVAYATLQKFRFVPAGANTGAVTLNINGIGAKAVTKSGTTALVAGDIPASSIVEVVYDGTRFQITTVFGALANAVATLNSAISAVVAVPTGGGMEWFSDTLPSGGWLWQNGAAVSRTTYAALFAVIGTTFGVGDGSTTFNLPDKRGRVGAGQDDMGGVTAASRVTSGGSGIDGATLGASGGEQTHTLTTTEMPSHTHSGVVGTSAVGNVPAGGSTVVPTGNAGIGSTGGGGAHNNMPPTLICNYIIKT